MKTKPYLKLLVLVISVLLVFLFTACDNNKEVETTYTYSFTVDSEDYTYELTINSNYSNVALKLIKNYVVVYDFEELYFQEDTNTINNLDNSFSMTLSLNSNNTFSISNINGEMRNLILGYEVYTGEYTATSGNSTANITLNSDGTCIINDDEMTYMPWNGNKVLLISPYNSAICVVDLENNILSIEGVGSKNMEYIFDATIYDLDDESPISDNNSISKLYISNNSNKAYLKLNNEQENATFSYSIVFGAYEIIDSKVTLTYEENNIQLLITNNTFDYFYEEQIVDEKWIRIYESIDKAVYFGSEGKAVYDLDNSSEDYYILTSYSDDITPIKLTRIINSTTLELMSIYIGDFQGLSDNSYTALDNSEIIIANDDVAYYNNAGETLINTQGKIYYANSYTRENYNPNAISIEGNYIMYYLDEETFYFYSQPSSEQMNSIISYVSQVHYGYNINYGDSVYYLASLVLSNDGQASVIIYNLATGSNGTISCHDVITGAYTIEGNTYAIATARSVCYVTVIDSVITDVSIVS